MAPLNGRRAFKPLPSVPMTIQAQTLIFRGLGTLAFWRTKSARFSMIHSHQTSRPHGATSANTLITAPTSSSRRSIGRYSVSSGKHGGFTYHPQELAFFSWFFRTRSIGTGGKYSFKGTLTSTQRLCARPRRQAPSSNGCPRALRGSPQCSALPSTLYLEVYCLRSTKPDKRPSTAGERVAAAINAKNV